MTPHTAIPVTNLERSILFYRSLGYKLTERWERPEWGMIGQLMVSETGPQLELIFHKDNVSVKYPAVPEVLHVAIAVSNLAELLKELTVAGTTILRPVTPGIKVDKLAFIKDPDGLAIELYEPKT